MGSSCCTGPPIPDFGGAFGITGVAGVVVTVGVTTTTGVEGTLGVQVGGEIGGVVRVVGFSGALPPEGHG